MSTEPPVIYWMRRDMRLADNPALSAAVASGRPVVPLFILDEVASAYKAAPSWRLARALERMDQSLKRLGLRLVLRRGPALKVLQQVIAETGAQAVCWTRDIVPDAIARDRTVKTHLSAAGILAQSFSGQLLWDPWTIQTEAGAPYRVYSPFWKRARAVEPEAPVPAPTSIRPYIPPLASDLLVDWGLDAPMNRGGPILAAHATAAGEAAAQDRLDSFLGEGLDTYSSARDRLDLEATSRLSAHLAWGEISPRSIWAQVRGLMARGQGGQGAEKFLSELAWREFAYHLLFHFPTLATENWRAEWNAFEWRGDTPAAQRWRQGCTGVAVVDAAMREMYVTGTMHNRARMICASYLTKHLLTDWRQGLSWFEDCLVDWDPASNAMGWQWVAGSGPDAAPFFRIFNPETQAQKFDPNGHYRRRWLPQPDGQCSDEAAAFFEAAPRRWALRADSHLEPPVISLADGRSRALAAYDASRGKR